MISYKKKKKNQLINYNWNKINVWVTMLEKNVKAIIKNIEGGIFKTKVEQIIMLC